MWFSLLIINVIFDLPRYYCSRNNKRNKFANRFFFFLCLIDNATEPFYVQPVEAGSNSSSIDTQHQFVEDATASEVRSFRLFYSFFFCLCDAIQWRCSMSKRMHSYSVDCRRLMRKRIFKIIFEITMTCELICISPQTLEWI